MHLSTQREVDNIGQVAQFTASVQHSFHTERLIDNRPTKSLGLILGLMHHIKLKINIDV